MAAGNLSEGLIICTESNQRTRIDPVRMCTRQLDGVNYTLFQRLVRIILRPGRRFLFYFGAVAFSLPL